MKLIIGGAYQGKLEYALKLGYPMEMVADGESASYEEILEKPVLNHFHLWIKRILKKGDDPEIWAARLLEKNPEVIILSNELGYGVVPMEAFERQYRECTGRVCCMLAGRAESVERIVCGMPMKLKGETE